MKTTIMRAAFVGLLALLPLSAVNKSVVMGAAGQITVDFTGVSAFQAVGSFTAVIGVDAIAADAGYNRLFGGFAFLSIRKIAGTKQVQLISGLDNRSCAVDFGSATKGALMFTRDIINARLDCYLTSLDGSIVQHTSDTITDLTLHDFRRTWWIDGATNVSVSYIGLSLGTVLSAQPCPAAVFGTYRWDFDGNLTATAGGIDYTPDTTPPSYSTDATLGPIVTLATTPYTVSTAFPVSLSATVCPVSAAGPTTIAWSKVSGAGTLTFSPSASVLAPSLTVSSVSGSCCVMRATATDAAANVSTRDITFYSVPTDSRGVIQSALMPGLSIPSSAISKILGSTSMYASGTETSYSPWPWFDNRQKAMLDTAIASFPILWQRYWQVETEPGTTVTVTTGTGQTVVGNGTHFGADFCVGGTMPCSGSGMLNGGFIVLWYASEDYPGQYGHYEVSVDSVADNTHLTIHQPFNRYFSHTCPGAGTSYCNMKWTAVAGANNDYKFYWQSGNHANYYDNVLAFYPEYLRTGNPAYLQWARDVADWFWEMPKMDRGMEVAEWGNQRWSNPFLEPRDWSLEGLILRALDGHPEMWVGIASMADFLAVTNSPNSTICVADCVPDHREGGYLYSRMALIAMFAPAGVFVPHPAYWTDPTKDIKTYAKEWLQAEGTRLAAYPKTNGIVYKLASAYGSLGSAGTGNSSAISTTNGSSVISRSGGTATNFAFINPTDTTFLGNISSLPVLATSGASATVTVSSWTVSSEDVNKPFTINSGTGFMVGIYRILSVNTGSNTWTLDRVCSTGAASGGAGVLGRPTFVWISDAQYPLSNADGDSVAYVWYQRRWNTSSGMTQIVVSGGTATATLPSGHLIASGGQIVVSGSATSTLNTGMVTTTGATSTTITWSSAAPNGTYTDATVIDNDHANLDRAYTGLTGSGKGWYAHPTPGYGVQPFMMGIALQGYSLAADALTLVGDLTGAAKWSALASSAADWMFQYGIRPSPNFGGWVHRGDVGCESYINTGVDFPAGIGNHCTAGDDPNNSRVLLGEMQGGLFRAYNLNPTGARATQIDSVFTHLWSKPGTSVAFPGDGYYLAGMDGNYMDATDPAGNFHDPGAAKWVGFFFGKGGGYQWMASRLNGIVILMSPIVHADKLRGQAIR